MFILASSFRSLQCLISTLIQEGKGGHLFRLTCSAVLWGLRDTANKYHWCVWGVLAGYGPHWVCPSSRWCLLNRSTLLRLQGALQEHCPKRALHFVHFPSLNCLVLGFLGTPQGHRLCSVRVLYLSQVQAAQATRCLVSTLFQEGHVS